MKSCVPTACLLFLALAYLAPNLFAQAQGGFTPFFESFVGVRAIAVQPDGGILLATINTSDGCIFRYYPGGKRDYLFGDGDTDDNRTTGHAIALQPDGKIILGATTSLSDVFNSKKVRRINANGTIDPSFNTVINAPGVESLAITPNGQVFVAGDFTTVNGATRIDIARLNSDGTLDPAFGDVQSDGSIKSMVLQPDGKLVVGGIFANIGGAARTGIARLNSDGTLDASFSSPLDALGQIFTISRQADGKFIVGGNFTITVGPQTYKNLVRLNANGSLDTTFALATGEVQQYPISATTIQPDGKIVVGGGGGSFVEYGVGLFYPRLAVRYNPDGSRDATVRNIVIKNPSVRAVALQADGKILLGGQIQGWRSDRTLTLSRIDTDGKWEVPFARFDYDGDKKADFSVFRPSNHTWYVHTGTAFSTFVFGEPTDLPAPGDYDFDGKTDFAVFRQSNGTWYWINSSATTLSTLQWGAPGDLPVQGHRVDEVKDAFDVFRPSNGRWYRRYNLRDGEGGSVWSFFSIHLGEPGDIPLAGHWGAEFESRPAVYRPSTSTFYFTSRWLGAETTSKQWGELGDVPVVADFDGDFLTDVATYRPSNGLWSIQLANGVTVVQSWGEPGDIPVPADYDGDQRDDIAVFRPSNGTWYIIGSTEGWRIRQFGVAGDIPVPSSYLYGD